MIQKVCVHTPPTPPGVVCEHTAGLGGFARANTIQPRKIWHLSFKANGDGPADELRIRGLLKVALRRFGLVCVDFSTTEGPADDGRPLPVRLRGVVAGGHGGETVEGGR